MQREKWIESQRQKISACLDELLVGVKHCALLDFPDYDNVGDAMIWLGEIAYLESRGIKLEHTCTRSTYSKAILERLPKDWPILISGGGNWGDLWPKHHGLKMRVIEDFPERRIIQLPVSVYYHTTAPSDLGAVNKHKRLTILARDEVSFHQLKTRFQTDVRLCPDMSLNTRRLSKQAQNVECLFLKRKDKETHSLTISMSTDLPEQDWRHPVFHLFYKLASLILLMGRIFSLKKQTQLLKILNYFAEHNMKRGIALIAPLKLLISDRLHAGLLADLLGVEHTVVDNSYGKIGNYYATWGSPEGCIIEVNP